MPKTVWIFGIAVDWEKLPEHMEVLKRVEEREKEGKAKEWDDFTFFDFELNAEFKLTIEEGRVKGAYIRTIWREQDEFKEFVRKVREIYGLKYPVQFSFSTLSKESLEKIKEWYQ